MPEFDTQKGLFGNVVGLQLQFTENKNFFV